MTTDKKESLEALEGTVLTEKEVKEKDDLIVVFKKPYNFEGEEYTEIDLRGLENVTTADLLSCEPVGTVNPLPEYTLNYQIALAAVVSKQPIEFFKNLPAKEGLKIKNAVMVFLSASE